MRLPATSPIPLDPSQAAPRAGIEKAARELETQFAQMLIKSMRSASAGDGLAGGDTRYRDMYDQQLARELGRGRGLGLAPMIMRQLERGQGGVATPATGTLPLRMPGDGAPAPMALPTVAAPATGRLPLAPASAGVSLAGTDVLAFAAPVHPSAPAPGAATLANAADPRLDASSPEAFVKSIWPQAQKAAAELGVPAKALVAQAALETGWGRRLVNRDGASSHNLFGIKAGRSWDGARMSANTHEFVAGTRVDERASFRAYGSVAGSFADYTRLLGSPRYAAARGTGEDTRRFAAALQQAGYATDPSYASKITAIANGATLNRALAAMPAGAQAIYAAAQPAAAPVVATAATGTRG